MPQDLKLRRLTTKYLLKKVLKKLLPSENLNRRKMGFGVPIGHWFRGKMQPFLREVVLSEKALRRGLFKPEAVKQLIELHTRGERDYSITVALLMLELLFKRFTIPLVMQVPDQVGNKRDTGPEYGSSREKPLRACAACGSNDAQSWNQKLIELLSCRQCSTVSTLTYRCSE